MLGKLSDAIAFARQHVGRSIEIQQLLIFLVICRQKGMKTEELAVACDVNRTSLSRNITSLCKRQLVQKEVNHEGRGYIYNPTNTGMDVYNKLVAFLA